MEVWIGRCSAMGQALEGLPWRPGLAVAPHRAGALEGLPWRPGSAVGPHRARALAAAVPEAPPEYKPSWRPPLTLP